MSPSIDQVRAKVASQKTLLPALYGNVDFDATPERFTWDPSAAVVRDRRPLGVEVTDEDLERVRAYTMLGDVVADAYAALIPQYGFRGLIDMLTRACEQGIAAVPDAPPELAAFIADMEATPDWVDMELVREGRGWTSTPPPTWRPSPCAGRSSPPSSTSTRPCLWP